MIFYEKNNQLKYRNDTFDCFLQDSKGECKMIAIENFMNIFLNVLNDTFRECVWFVGLQGSYGRDEATETSDIDVVVIIDELSA